MRANALVVMAKAPLAGLVKTRLVPPLSPEQAAELYRALFLDLLEGLKGFQEADLFVAFAPDESAPWFHDTVPSAFACFPQCGGDLGERMSRAFAQLASRGYRSVALIGSDLPGLPAPHLQEAFRRLAELGHEVVLGPSRDGGYYLIGMSRQLPEIFQGIPWGSNRVLRATVERLSVLGIRTHFLLPWFDIDTVQDLHYLKSIAKQWTVRLPHRTLRFLEELDTELLNG